MVKVGRRFFFNQTFQKKQRRITIVTTIVVILAIIITFSVTSYFHDNSGEKAVMNFEVKESYDVEIFTIMPSFFNYFNKIENVPLSSIKISYDEKFSYDENGDNCSDEQLNIIKEIRNGHVKAEDYNDPFACLNFVPNKVGTYKVTITIDGNPYYMALNVVDSYPPTFEAQDVTITNEETYNASSFITSCEDNSKTNCAFDFYHPLRGEIIDYSKYTEPGEYEIKVVAKDQSGNVAEPKTVKLTIKKVNYYTITFNSNGGSSIESQTIKEGDKIYSPYPTRDGYTFDGWYYGNSKYDFNKPASSDMTLVAKWKSTSSNSGGSSSGRSSGGSSGGSSSSKCQYGKYSDYHGEISIYANVLNGKSLNDCTDKNDTNDYNELRDYVIDIAYELTERDKGAIDLDFQKLVGTSAKINHNIHTNQIINKGGLIGILVTIDSEANGYKTTYTLYNCNTSSCKWR